MAEYKKEKQMGPGEAASSAPGGIPGVEENMDLDQTTMKNNLDSTLQDLKGKRGAIQAQEYVGKNKLEAAKAEMIQSIFEILKNVGVDPTDMESIQAFIEQLSNEDPDLLKLFDAAFVALSTDPEMAPDMTAAPENVAQAQAPAPAPGMQTEPGMGQVGKSPIPSGASIAESLQSMPGESGAAEPPMSPPAAPMAGGALPPRPRV